MMASPINEPSAPRAIAIVSGKGGSGKTIIGAVLAEIFDAADQSLILVDADTGTAGLTFYFGTELVNNTSVGLTDLFLDPSRLEGDRLTAIVRPIKGFKQAKFLSVGDYRRFPKDLTDTEMADRMRIIVGRLKELASFIVFDCRGGLDDESLAVCRCVDDILLIVETDTTSYQATQRLVDTLSESDLALKLKGFMINKVFDNPKTIAKNGTAAFRSQYLTAIPFDFDAMRDFFTGRIPRPQSVFGVHVQHGLRQAYSEIIPDPSGRVYSFEEYEEIGFVNLDSLRGGIVLSLFLVASAGVLLFYWRSPLIVFRPTVPISVALLTFLGLLGSISKTRQSVGRAINRLVSFTLIIKRR